MPNINSISGIDISKAFNKAYPYAKAAANTVSDTGATKAEKLLIKFKECQGETFNNLVTAVGTAAIAPIFIIHNPLAKEDKQTKEYTAARQPISAVITLAAQVPIMYAYNSALDHAATKYHFDKCDLAAAPPKTYLGSAVKHDWKKYLAGCLKRNQQPENKKKVKEDLYNQHKAKAFYSELGELRESMLKGNQPEYFAKSIENGFVKIDDMIDQNDIKNAKKELIEKYFKEKYNIDVTKDLELGKNIKIESLDVLGKKSVKKAFKDKNVDITKDLVKDLKEILNTQAEDLAQKNVETYLQKSAKVKLYTSKLYKNAKAELSEYQRQLLIAKTPNDEMQRLMTAKNAEIFEKLRNHAIKLVSKAPETVPAGDMTLTLEEAQTLLKKIDDKITKGSAEDKLVRHLRIHGEKFEDVLKSVQTKKWLTARINKSEKYLSDFKQKSGLIVGLAILPFTCGLLNWAYPRIMEEWFPELAHAKKASKEKKEAK